MKRMERELKTVNSKLLYKRKPKNSLNNADNTLKLLQDDADDQQPQLANTSFANDPPQTPPNSPNNKVSNAELNNVLANHVGDNKRNSVHSSVSQKSAKSSKSKLPPTSDNHHHQAANGPQANNNHRHSPNSAPEPHGKTPSSPASVDRGSSVTTTIQPNTTQINAETGKSVIVNLSLTGSNIEDKRRLSRLLQQVNQMRQLRERHNSYGSEQSLEAKIETLKEIEMRKIYKIQRSKRLMCKYRVYDFLKRPATLCAFIYHMVAFILVAACLIVSVFPNMEHMHILEQYFGGKMQVLDLLEKIVLFWFTAEYLLRLWSCGCRPQYQGWRGKLAFMKSPAHLIDLLVIILSAIVSLWTKEGHEVFAFRAFRGFHRFFQVIQVITIKRQLRPWRLFLSVLYDQREQLMIIFYLEIVILSLLAYLSFLVEHQANEQMETIADVMWWSIVTLTTVGYGDKVPETWLGKIISATFILFGFCVFALPAGIIGAGLALKLEEVERFRQRRKKKDAAAMLIQRAWKCYRANLACFELSAFFRHQPGDLYKLRVFENITQAFICTVRFYVAKSNFKVLTRSVDLRNVIESYKYGQVDIFERLKHMNTALDIIISRMSMADRERITAMKQLSKTLSQLRPLPGNKNDNTDNVPNDNNDPSSLSDGSGFKTGANIIRTQSGTYLINSGIENVASNVPFYKLYDLVHIPQWNQYDSNMMDGTDDLQRYQRPQSMFTAYGWTSKEKRNMKTRTIGTIEETAIQNSSFDSGKNVQQTDTASQLRHRRRHSR